MKIHTFAKRGIIFSVFALAIIIGTASESSVYAQGPCPIDPLSPDPYIEELSLQILYLQAQGATVTCDNTSMYVSFPSGLYFRISAPEGLPVSMFVFDPVTGRIIYWYVLGGMDDNPPTILVHDSVYGTINLTDGWFSIFYPVGNPFSAAIQNPMQALMMGFHAQFADPWGYTEPGPRPAPIQPPSGIQ